MARSLLKEIFLSFICKILNADPEKIERYTFYKIVDLKEEKYILQCINKNVMFEATITDIIFDINILYGLHPIQTCYIGMEYAKHIKKTNTCPTLKNKPKKSQDNFLSRYGLYNLCYQNRKGDICFINKKTSEKFILDLNELVTSEKLIREFDASQAFYIGLFYGLKTSTSSFKNHDTLKPYLSIVK